MTIWFWNGLSKHKEWYYMLYLACFFTQLISCQRFQWNPSIWITLSLGALHLERVYLGLREGLRSNPFNHTAIRPLQWRHNGRDSVSNHQPHDCLLNRLFRRRLKKTLKLRVTGLVRGIHRGPVNSAHKWPVTWKMFPFYDVIMIKKHKKAQIMCRGELDMHIFNVMSFVWFLFS